MMQMDSGGGPFPNDGLHQLFRHYRSLLLLGFFLYSMFLRDLLPIAFQTGLHLNSPISL